MTVNPYESPGAASASPPRASWGTILLRAVLGFAIIGILVGLLLPARRSVPEAGRRAMCINNLKNINLALLNYEESYHSFPPAYTVDAEGNRLHSWRTLILPYLDRNDLYRKVDFTKPWDDPANREVYDEDLAIFYCPSAVLPAGQTTYVAVVAPNGLFSGSEGRKVEENVDGPSNTILVLETEPARSVHWMSPEDVDEEWLRNLANVVELSHPSGINVAYGDGRVTFLQQGTDEETIRALISIAGGDNEDAESQE
jgi:prepilin-type processing-associated H-X9-DG protein